MTIRILLTVLVMLGLTAPAAARTVAGVALAERIDVGGTVLPLDGTAVHYATALSIPVFAIGLYHAAAGSVGQRAVCAGPTGVRLHWLRNVSRERVARRWRASLRRHAADAPATAARIDALLDALPDLRDGDLLSVDWTREHGLVLAHNGRQRVSLPGPDLCRALLASLVDEFPEIDPGRALLASRR